MRVLGISGSLRRSSFNTALLRAAGKELPDGAELVLFEGLGDIPPFDEDAEHAPPAIVQELKRAIEQADAVLFSTPEYNASIPGQLKNAIDWVSRPFGTNPLRDKPTAVVGASTGMFGAVWAQAELRKVLAHLGARVLDDELPVMHAADVFTLDGWLGDDAVRDALRDHVTALVAGTPATVPRAA